MASTRHQWKRQSLACCRRGRLVEAAGDIRSAVPRETFASGSIQSRRRSDRVPVAALMGYRWLNDLAHFGTTPVAEYLLFDLQSASGVRRSRAAAALEYRGTHSHRVQRKCTAAIFGLHQWCRCDATLRHGCRGPRTALRCNDASEALS